MKFRNLLLIGTAGTAVLLAWFIHVFVGDRVVQMEAARGQADRQLQQARSQVADQSRRIEAAHERLRALLAEAPGKAKEVDRGTKPPPAAPVASSSSRNAKIARAPALREMAVTAYVDDQRLMFTGLLGKLGFTPEQMQRFDAIQADYVQGTLQAAALAEEQHLAANAPALAAMRRQADQARDAAYQTLFGPAYPQWIQENSTLPARQLVSQIAQQNFPGAGALSGSQADQLTGILAANTVKDPANTRSGGSTNYDWDAVLLQASSVLKPEQLEGFKTGVELHLAQTYMSAIVSNPGAK
jgi:hypothetical protein